MISLFSGVYRSRHVLFCFVVVASYFWLSFFFGSGMFDNGETDGFYSQIKYFHYNFDDFRPLWFVHFFRYIVVYPFWWLDLNGFGGFAQSVVFLLYVFPFVVFRIGGVGDYIKAFVVFLPFFVSYRTVLVVVSLLVVFQFVYFCKGRLVFFVVSALFANLSSGVVLAWLVLCFFYRDRFLNKGFSYLAPFFLVLFSFCFSLVNKVGYFYFYPFPVKEEVYYDETLSVKRNDLKENSDSIVNSDDSSPIGQVQEERYNNVDGVRNINPDIYDRSIGVEKVNPKVASGALVHPGESSLIDGGEEKSNEGGNGENLKNAVSSSPVSKVYQTEAKNKRYSQGLISPATDALEQEAKPQGSHANENIFNRVIKRSSIFVYVEKRNWPKIIAYLGLFGALITAFLISFFRERYISAFFATGLVGFLVEGLWVVAFIMPVMMYLGRFFYMYVESFVKVNKVG